MIEGVVTCLLGRHDYPAHVQQLYQQLQGGDGLSLQFSNTFKVIYQPVQGVQLPGVRAAAVPGAAGVEL